jgi:glycosyltransferase involved in cell wall biosynthesis
MFLKHKICVYAISKNEEKFVDRWVDSMSEADMITVTDTGSTDETVKKLKSKGIVVFEKKIIPWRFDVARNISLSHVPFDCEIAVCTDLDEVFKPGWRRLIEKAWVPDATMGNYLFNFAINANGTPHIQLVYFKIHSRNSYKWVWPVHECLSFVPTKKHAREKKIFINGLILNHFPDETKSRSSYLELLESAVKEYPKSDRMAYYLGREYMFVGRWQDSINTLEQYLLNATWAEERCVSMRWIAVCYFNLKKKNKAYSWFFRAISELPTLRDTYIEFAKIAYYFKDWLTIF